MKPITISTECGDSLDKFVDKIEEKCYEKDPKAEDFYVEVKDNQTSRYPELHKVDFLVLENKKYDTYIRHQQPFNIDKEPNQDFNSALDKYIFTISDRLSKRGIITEINDKQIKIYSVRKSLMDQKKGKEQPYDFNKLAKIKLIKKIKKQQPFYSYLHSLIL